MKYLIIITMLLSSCSKKKDEITYVVKCSDCFVSYTIASGAKLTENPIYDQWNITFDDLNIGHRYSVLAQSNLCWNFSDLSDPCSHVDSTVLANDFVTTEIYFNGKIQSSTTRSSEYATARSEFTYE